MVDKVLYQSDLEGRSNTRAPLILQQAVRGQAHRSGLQLCKQMCPDTLPRSWWNLRPSWKLPETLLEHSSKNLPQNKKRIFETPRSKGLGLLRFRGGGGGECTKRRDFSDVMELLRQCSADLAVTWEVRSPHISLQNSVGKVSHSKHIGVTFLKLDFALHIASCVMSVSPTLVQKSCSCLL